MTAARQGTNQQQAGSEQRASTGHPPSSSSAADAHTAARASQRPSRAGSRSPSVTAGSGLSSSPGICRRHDAPCPRIPPPAVTAPASGARCRDHAPAAEQAPGRANAARSQPTLSAVQDFRFPRRKSLQPPLINLQRLTEARDLARRKVEAAPIAERPPRCCAPLALPHQAVPDRAQPSLALVFQA